MLLEKFESLLDQISQDKGFTLSILDFVAEVDVAVLEQVEDRENLSVVRHKSLTNSVGAKDQLLEDLKCNGNDLLVSGV